MQKPNSKAKHWLRLCVLESVELSHKGGFSKTRPKYRIKCERGCIPTLTHRQLPNNYQVLRALVPRAPG